MKFFSSKPDTSRDPGQAALARHFESEAPAEPEGGPGSGTRRSRILIIALSALVVAFVVASGALGWVALENHSRGQEWRERSEALRGLVEQRTQALNRQTARLNTASTRLRTARRAIARSEADVAALEDRQRELANEKAQVEDQRGALQIERDALESDRDSLVEQGRALEGLAIALIECNRAMGDVVGASIDGWVPDLMWAEAQATCTSADSTLKDYLGRYG